MSGTVLVTREEISECFLKELRASDEVSKPPDFTPVSPNPSLAPVWPDEQVGFFLSRSGLLPLQEHNMLLLLMPVFPRLEPWVLASGPP